ncbi:MAG: hypothetical protein H6970_13255 [Gammaproteobacteria bacterium]|nr:hypothetical protein [Gammaproteobacteria bacterium]MCP5458669.1 hypothetical protein [Gammaproteobacteria bacterium]
MNHNYPAPYYYYPAQGQSHQTAVCGNYLEQGKFGAVVGLCGAGAANLRRYQRAEINAGEALLGTLKTGLYTGLATAAAGLVADRFHHSPALTLLATLATGTAVMYALSGDAQEGGHE